MPISIHEPDTPVLYFAYGSNLHPLRLRGRVPSAALVATARLDTYRLAFHKRGMDGSAKCDIVWTGRPDGLVFGALFDLPDGGRGQLDKFEGVGRGYQVDTIVVHTPRGDRRAFTYRAQDDFVDVALKPFHWYKALVLSGAAFHGFPRAYVDSIEAVDSAPDHIEERAEDNARLLAKIEAQERGDRHESRRIQR